MALKSTDLLFEKLEFVATGGISPVRTDPDQVYVCKTHQSRKNTDSFSTYMYILRMILSVHNRFYAFPLSVPVTCIKSRRGVTHGLVYSRINHRRNRRGKPRPNHKPKPGTSTEVRPKTQQTERKDITTKHRSQPDVG